MSDGSEVSDKVRANSSKRMPRSVRPLPSQKGAATWSTPRERP